MTTMPCVECPRCASRQLVAAEAVGELMDCRYCNSAFPAIPVADAEPYEPTGVAAFFTERYEPADPAERAAVIAEAQERVRRPAHGLIVTGIIGIVATVLIGVGTTMTMLTGRRPVTADAIWVVGIFVAIGFWFFIIVAGARALRRLENAFLCTVAAGLAILSAAFCGVWLMISIPGVIYGTWAFTALCSREVRHAMRWKREERREGAL